MRPKPERPLLPAITTSDLSRGPREVIERVLRGDRLVIHRHGIPVATLQPLDGYVLQPFDGTVLDVFGWPLGTESDQTDELPEIERRLLLDGYRQWRLRPARLHEFEWSDLMAAIEDMTVRGLVRRTPRGLELTGRGLALREALMKMEGRQAELWS